MITSSGIALAWSGSWVQTGSYSLSQVAGRMTSGDFNRDGRSDVAVLYDYGGNHVQIHTWLSSGSALGWSSGFNWDSTSYTASAIGDRFVSGDFNGDGRTDLGSFYQSGSTAIAHIWPSTGSAFTWGGDNGWAPLITYTLSNVSGRMVAGDFTGSGYDDIATFYSFGASSSRIDTWSSTGSAFGSRTTWFSSTGGYTLSVVGNRMVAGDFDNK